uniref:Uncharacterized protein n=1 Tax=Tetradesmus obliquus TaxID=3088 RepID=A0A383V4H6_TETOB|eukprot:jgi/Sobl393_1/1347/SZX59820.1
MASRSGQDNFQLLVITHDEHFAHLIGTRTHAEWLWRITKDDNQRSHIAQEEILDEGWLAAAAAAGAPHRARGDHGVRSAATAAAGYWRVVVVVAHHQGRQPAQPHCTGGDPGVKEVTSSRSLLGLRFAGSSTFAAAAQPYLADRDPAVRQAGSSSSSSSSSRGASWFRVASSGGSSSIATSCRRRSWSDVRVRGS